MVPLLQLFFHEGEGPDADLAVTALAAAGEAVPADPEGEDRPGVREDQRVNLGILPAIDPPRLAPRVDAVLAGYGEAWPGAWCPC